MENSELIPPVMLMIYCSGSVACRLLILAYLSFSPSGLSCQFDLRKITHHTAFMGRSPCCEKIGLKKGPWTPEEDQKLLAFIEEHGHGSWRALPAKAGEYGQTWILPSSKWTKFVRSRPTSCRLAEVWEELQIEVDKLPEAGHQEGQIQLARRADHHPASCSFRQQVSTSEISQLQIVTVVISSEVLRADPLAYVSCLASFC